MRAKIFSAAISILILSVAGFAQAGPAQWEKEIAAFETADKQTPPPQNAVLFIGSSSIRMWRTLAEDFPQTKTINRGFGGSQVADSTHYIDRIVIPYRPKTIVFYAGDNDLNDRKTPEQIFADYKQFVAKVREKLPKTRIAFIAIKPSPARAALLPNVAAANKLIREYSTKKRNLRYIDVYTPMMGKDGQPRPELFTGDRLHMNAGGYALWTKIVAPYLR